MPRSKFFVGGIFSGLFLPRNLRTKGLKVLEILKYFCDSHSDRNVHVLHSLQECYVCPNLNQVPSILPAVTWLHRSVFCFSAIHFYHLQRKINTVRHTLLLTNYYIHILGIFYFFLTFYINLHV